MGFPALTTAIQIAAASVPAEAVPPTPTAAAVDLVALDQSAQATALATDPNPPAGTVVTDAPGNQPQSNPPADAAEPAQPAEPANAAGTPETPDAAVQTPNPTGSDAIVVTGRGKSSEDPLQELNAESYKVTQKVDTALVAPVAFAYKEALPSPLRRGLINFLNNLSEPIVFLNFLLQLKPGKAAETFGRFAINTTIGGAGLVDVAKRKPFHLPYRNNGFANTLGFYGVKPGAYFYLPLIGSTTVRDFIGNRVDQVLLPMMLGSPFNRPEFAIPAAALNELNDRIEFDDQIRRIRAQQDPYVASREFYLRKRQAEIDALHGWGDSTIRVIVSASSTADAAPLAPPTVPVPSSGAHFTRQ